MFCCYSLSFVVHNAVYFTTTFTFDSQIKQIILNVAKMDRVKSYYIKYYCLPSSESFNTVKIVSQ